VPEPTTETTEVTPADRPAPAAGARDAAAPDPLVEQELLVEDVSIDGMCGVY
jgi:mycofactocin precursor